MNTRVKVLALIWDMGNGGAQQIVINNLRFFKGDNDIDYKVISFCPPRESKNDIVIRQENLNVEYLGYPKSRIKIPIIRYPFNKHVERLAWEEVIKREKPDIVHVHISELLLTTLGPVLSNEVKVRFDTLHSDPYRYKGRALKCIKRAFHEEGFIPICLNEKQAGRAKLHYGIKDYEIVHNGIDYDAIKDRIITKQEARQKIGVSDKSYLVAGVGRLDPIKNYELMLEVFKEIVSNKPEAVLVIAGGGDQTILRAKAESLGITKSVKFLGQVNNITEVYCAADVLLMTSFSEASPLTLVEAQICGLRCVVSDGVPRESAITTLVSQMPAGSNPQDWAKTVLEGDNEVCDIMPIDTYDLQLSNERIKEVYLKYWNKYNG